jgi:hypothetical protein
MRSTILASRLACVVLTLLVMNCCDSHASAGQPSYYMIVFATQKSLNRPKFAHSFATFIKATDDEASPNGPVLQSHTISWLSANADVELVRLRPEAGFNFDLPSTLNRGRSIGARISMWGPYQIQEELYNRAVRQALRLDSQAIGYKVLDRRFRPDVASNCIHAVTDLDMDNGLLDTGTERGEGASQLIVDHLRRWIINPAETHSWISQRLGLDQYTIAIR